MKNESKSISKVRHYIAIVLIAAFAPIRVLAASSAGGGS